MASAKVRRPCCFESLPGREGSFLEVPASHIVPEALAYYIGGIENGDECSRVVLF